MDSGASEEEKQRLRKTKFWTEEYIESSNKKKQALKVQYPRAPLMLLSLQDMHEHNESVNMSIITQNQSRWNHLMRPLSPKPPDRFRFDYESFDSEEDYTEGKTTRLLDNANSIFLKRARSAVKAIIPEVEFNHDASDFQPLKPEDLHIPCNIQQLLDPIPFWWLHCVENATWWSKPRNNILAKEIMYQHFLSYCDPYDWTSEQDRVMASEQLFWEAFYQVQPIPPKDKLIRRVKRLSDGSKKRTVHVRLPNLKECQKEVVRLLRRNGLFCIFMEESTIPAIPSSPSSEEVQGTHTSIDDVRPTDESAIPAIPVLTSSEEVQGMHTSTIDSCPTDESAIPAIPAIPSSVNSEEVQGNHTSTIDSCPTDASTIPAIPSSPSSEEVQGSHTPADDSRPNEPSPPRKKLKLSDAIPTLDMSILNKLSIHPLFTSLPTGGDTYWLYGTYPYNGSKKRRLELASFVCVFPWEELLAIWKDSNYDYSTFYEKTEELHEKQEYIPHACVPDDELDQVIIYSSEQELAQKKQELIDVRNQRRTEAADMLLQAYNNKLIVPVEPEVEEVEARTSSRRRSYASNLILGCTDDHIISNVEEMIQHVVSIHA